MIDYGYILHLLHTVGIYLETKSRMGGVARVRWYMQVMLG